MISRSLAPLLLVAAASAGPALAAPADRHPGVYQFRPVDPAVCAGKERQKGPRQPVRPQRLGDLPPAFVLRLAQPTRPRTDAAHPAPSYDPCATIERVR